ncbi:MAG TPA: hypothetical protein PKE00_11065, partial [Planctomycetota bacterium]|nr:hypothetical protein [Planctomycetota bacterium]
MWHERLKEARAAGKIVVIGLIEEQHPDRCRLFLEWQGIDWPILVDSLNRSGVWAVPLVWAIDEHGVLRHTKPSVDWVLGDFLETTYDAPAETRVTKLPPSPAEASYLAGDYTTAIDLAGKELAAQPSHALHFLIGCAHRARCDAARPGSPTATRARNADFQAAIDAWTRAIDAAPQNYIYRRRIQQYGPRLDKPYPFYDWVEEARNDLKQRGHEPPPLLVEPEGAEVARPLNKPEAATAAEREARPPGSHRSRSASRDGHDRRRPQPRARGRGLPPLLEAQHGRARTALR